MNIPTVEESRSPVEPREVERKRSSRFWQVYLGGGVACLALYFGTNSPAAQEAIFPVIGMGSAVAVLAGVRRNRPTSKLPWLLIAVGLFLWGLGDAIWSGYDLVLHRPAPWPSVADVVYLAGPIFLIFGLSRMLRQRSGGRDVYGWIDALIIATGFGTLSWAFLISPYAADASLPLLEKFVAVAYPAVDILLLVVTARLLLTPGRHATSHRLIATALAFTLVADIVYSLQQLAGTYYTGHIVDAGWIVFYFLMGAAALHPSMGSGANPRQEEARPSRRRLSLLVAAVSMAPLTMVIQQQRGATVDIPAIAGASVILFALVLFRMERLVRQVHRNLGQLHDQGEALHVALDEQHELESQLRHQALHDPLTGLPNRVLFGDRLDHAIQHIGRSGENVGLLFLDLDDFKGINDTMGHEAGDSLLVEVGARLQNILRVTDTPARLGGDEFAILLDRMADAGDAQLVAARLLDAMKIPFNINGREVAVRVSVGIAVADNANATARELQSQADIAMYAAKRGGKSSYVVFEPRPEQETAGDLQLGPDLGNALDRDELRAVYQPIVNLETQAITGVEALVRWEHPVQGLISPAQFLPLAEHYGIIFDLDMWMLKQACDELAIWRGPDLQRPFDINVNLSGDSLQHPDLLPRVVEILLASGADPRDLVIELTEGVLIRDVEMAVTKLRELKALGIRIAVDDFGTGYSSLAYLRRFPLDILKIDKSFVDGIAAGPEEASFAGTIVALADQLHLSTVAEGVECMEQAEVLLRLGVRQAQGYFFSRPTTARAVQELIESPSHLADSPTLVAVPG